MLLMYRRINYAMIRQLSTPFKNDIINEKIPTYLCVNAQIHRRINKYFYEPNAILQKQQIRNLSIKPPQIKDDNNVTLIYKGTLADRMKIVKLFSLTTSVIGLAAQPILLDRGMELGGTPLAIFFCSFGAFFTFLTPFLFHLITKKYVTEIHYNANTDEYIATTVSIFLQKIFTRFRPGDVIVPEVPGMFTSFIVHSKPLFVDPALFENTDHYVRIMGYDKPIDYKLNLKEPIQSTQNKKEEKRVK